MTAQATGRQRRLRILWRPQVLRVACAGMEISWFTPFFLIFVPAARLLPPYLVAGFWGLVMLGYYGWSALADAWPFSERLERAVLWLTLPAVILLAWRLFLHPGLQLADLSWIRAAGSGLFVLSAGGYWTVTVAALFIWWRGLALHRREVTFETAALAFRSGLLLLVLGTLLLSQLLQQQVMAFIVPFFFCGLLAVALARLEEVGQIKGEVGRIFDLSWLATLVSAAALTVGLAGWLLIRLARPEGLEALRELWAPVGNLLLQAVLWLIGLLLAPFEPILTWLSNVIAQAWLSLLESPLLESIGVLDIGQIEQASSSSFEQLVAGLLTLLRLACGVGVLAALLLAGLYLLRHERRRRGELEEVHESLDVSLGQALANLAREAQRRLRAAASLVSQFGVSGDLLAAVSVRNIYANATRLARRRGYPRPRACTPYEYLADLQAAFPGAQAEAAAITEAYVAVHYGELRTQREEMDALRDAYHRLKASPPPPG